MWTDWMQFRRCLAVARSWLFVPGDKPELFRKAASSEADVIVLDLEDGVADDRKTFARERAREWLLEGAAVVRINGSLSKHYRDDLESLQGVARAVILAKVESPEEVDAARERLGETVDIIPLFESAKGLNAAAAILARPGVIRPAFGNLDFSLDVGVDSRCSSALDFARFLLGLAAASEKRSPPIDGVTADLQNADVLRRDIRQAALVGCAAKLCIHPSQVGEVNRSFAPSPEQIQWATTVADACTSRAVAVIDGQMVDRPDCLQAERILKRSKQLEELARGNQERKKVFDCR